MSARWDVLGIGVVAVDDLVYVRHYPEPDTKMQVEAEERHGGGLTATAMVAASRLGARAAYCAILGDDELSRFTLDELKREGVDCSPVIYRPGARPYHATIIVDQASGARTILYTTAGVEKLTAADAGEELITSCRMLFLDHHTGDVGLHVVPIAHAHGIPVIADIEGISDEATQQLLHEADYLIVGVELAREVTGESEPVAMVRALARAGRACTAVTGGACGCWYAERAGEVQAFPAFPMKAVDTTGCGDVFHGAYAAYIARGASIDEAIRVAAAAAALKATRPGGRMGIPDRQRVEQFLAGQPETYPAYDPAAGA